jgi:hypothetical protein
VTNSSDYPNWRDEFVLSRDARELGRTSELSRDVRNKRLISVCRGAYRYADAITSDPTYAADDAFLARVRAAHLLNVEQLVFAGFAAAAVWGLPIVGPWPPVIQVVSPFARGGRSNATLSRSYVGGPAEVVQRDGVLTTSLARTVVDVARTGTFGQAVVMADAALHGRSRIKGRLNRAGTTTAALSSELERLGRVAGSAQCRRVISFANGASESPGESLSRAAFYLLRLPIPELQVPFSDKNGLIGIVDFWWPKLGLIGEFDGLGKYMRDELRNGRTIDEVVMDEKKREDRLRATGARVTRWGWIEARSLDLLGDHLRSAGLK